MSSNKLIEIPQSDWEKLRDLYVNHKNRSSSYSTIQNFIDWINQDPLIEDLNIYSLNGDWESDGTFILKWMWFIFYDSLNENQDRIIAALNCLNNDPSYIYCLVMENMLPIISKHMENKGWNNDEYEIEKAIWYHISKEEIKKLKVELPPGITIRTLNDEHTEITNNTWPHKYPGSEIFIHHLIRYNLNVGLFDENNSLIGWCLRRPFGGLGMLQVADKYKRKGLAQLMVCIMAKKISSLGQEVTAPVVPKNIASRNLFEKIGYKMTTYTHWIYFESKYGKRLDVLATPLTNLA